MKNRLQNEQLRVCKGIKRGKRFSWPKIETFLLSANHTGQTGMQEVFRAEVSWDKASLIIISETANQQKTYGEKSGVFIHLGNPKIAF